MSEIAESGQRRECELPTPAAELVAVAARLAELDAVAFRSEAPRTDAKVGHMLSLVGAVGAVIGVVGTLGTAVSLRTGATAAAWLIGAAAVVIVAGLVMVFLMILPRLAAPAGGPMVTVAELADQVAVRTHYLTAAQDPLDYVAGAAWLHARVAVGRYRRAFWSGVVLLAGLLLGLAGGLALGWGW
jgi:hypothetical protein